MSYIIPSRVGTPQSGFRDYELGDTLMNDSGKPVGVCTGFSHDDTCVDIDGRCWGGKYYFHKYDTIDIEVEEL